MGLMLQLLSNEAKIVQALKDCQDVAEIAFKIGITREAVYYLLKRLIQFGVIHRTGNKRHYCHTVKNIPYEIVKRRSRPDPEESIVSDKLIKASKNTELTKEQLFYFKNHKSLPRTEMARRLGLTKLQLNFAVLNAGSKIRGSGK
jgi:hypothetical protein